MTTRRFSSDESIYKGNRTRHDGFITNRTRNGSYNIVEKEYDDHKVIYHIPIEYGDDYDVSQLEDIPIDDGFSQRNSPKLTRRRIIQQYDDVEYDDEREYIEEIPVYTPRRRVYYSPRPRRDPPIIRKIYRTRSPIETVEYIYEDDSSDFYDYRPQPVEQVEYIIEERLPPTKQIYMEEPRPTRRTVYIEETPAPPPPPPLPPQSPQLPPPVIYSPRRSPQYQSSPRPPITHRSPSPIRTRPIRRNDPSPPLSTRKPSVTRSPLYEPVKPNIPKTTEPPLRLMDVIAQNRARRGSRIPKPRREVDEDQVYDPPTYKRNIIKNGFIVHK